MLGALDRRPELGCPALTLWDALGVGFQKRRVSLVPLGRLPAATLEEVGPLLDQARMNRAEPYIARFRDRLERVDDIVDFAVVLGAALGNVGTAKLVGLEAGDIGLAQVHAWHAIGHPFGDRL